MNSELITQVLNILLPSLATLIAAWFAVLGNKIKVAYEEKINTQIKKDVVATTVEYVEQVWKDLKGEEKLNAALERASEILIEKGIVVSEVELRTLIESAVYGLNQGLNDNKKTLKENNEKE